MEAKQLFSKEEIRNISDLGNVLREIRARLKREGISIEDAHRKLQVTQRRKKHFNNNHVSKQRQQISTRS